MYILPNVMTNSVKLRILWISTNFFDSLDLSKDRVDVKTAGDETFMMKGFVQAVLACSKVTTKFEELKAERRSPI